MHKEMSSTRFPFDEVNQSLGCDIYNVTELQIKLT